MVADFRGQAKGEIIMERTKERGIFEKVQDSGIFWIRFTDGQGKYRREVAGSYSQATKLLSKRRGEALQRKKLPESLRQRIITFSELAEDALVYSEAHKRSARSDISIKKTVVELFGNREADSLFGNELEERLDAEAKKRKWSASTFNHHRAFLMLAYREGRRKRKATANPARDVRHRKENNSRVRFLSREADGKPENAEDARLTAVIKQNYPEHLAEFIFAKSTGLRLSSQYAATYEMIDWSRRELTIPRTKNDAAVHTPLNEDVIRALQSLPSWTERKGPLFRNLRHPGKAVMSNDHWFKKCLATAGISNFKWHDLRHTFASWLVQDGVPLDRVARLLGHKSLTMTMRYAHLAPSQLHADVALLVRTNSTPVAPMPESGKSDSASYLN
jgi:integrase